MPLILVLIPKFLKCFFRLTVIEVVGDLLLCKFLKCGSSVAVGTHDSAFAFITFGSLCFYLFVTYLPLALILILLIHLYSEVEQYRYFRNVGAQLHGAVAIIDQLHVSIVFGAEINGGLHISSHIVGCNGVGNALRREHAVDDTGNLVVGRFTFVVCGLELAVKHLKHFVHTLGQVVYYILTLVGQFCDTIEVGVVSVVATEVERDRSVFLIVYVAFDVAQCQIRLSFIFSSDVDISVSGVVLDVLHTRGQSIGSGGYCLHCPQPLVRGCQLVAKRSVARVVTQIIGSSGNYLVEVLLGHILKALVGLVLVEIFQYMLLGPVPDVCTLVPVSTHVTANNHIVAHSLYRIRDSGNGCLGAHDPLVAIMCLGNDGHVGIVVGVDATDGICHGIECGQQLFFLLIGQD